MSASLFAGCATLILGLPIEPPPMLTPKVEQPELCLVGRADIAGRLELSQPDVGVSRRFALARGHALLGLDYAGMASARVFVGATRTGGQVGYIGVAGESFVPRFILAEARFTWRAAGFTIAAGLVDDPWVFTGNMLWGQRAMGPITAEERGLFFRSDLGGLAGWTSPLSIATVQVGLFSGEGGNIRERNNGKNLTGMLTVRPLAPLAPSHDGIGKDALEISVLARDGSRGLLKARDHRGALRVTGSLGPVRLGWEGIKAWGVGGDADREPVAMSVWASLSGLGPALGYGRLDVMNEGAPGTAATESFVIRAGGGVALPPHTKAKPLHVMLGYEGRVWGADVAPLAGSEALSESHTFVVQIGFLADFAVNVLPRPGAADAAATDEPVSPSGETP